MANSSNRDAYFFISYVYIHPTAKQYANKGNAIRQTICNIVILGKNILPIRSQVIVISAIIFNQDVFVFVLITLFIILVFVSILEKEEISPPYFLLACF